MLVEYRARGFDFISVGNTFTDSAALKDPDAVWGRLLRASFSAIQTDEIAALRSYLETNKFAAAGKAKAAV